MSILTTMSFTKQGMSGSSKRTTYKKARQGRQIKRSWSVEWWRGKHSVRKIFTLGFWRSNKVLALRRNKTITWHLLCRMKGENLVEGENLSKYKINKLQHGKCFARYLRTRFYIGKFTHSFSDTSTTLMRKKMYKAPPMKKSIWLICESGISKSGIAPDWWSSHDTKCFFSLRYCFESNVCVKF